MPEVKYDALNLTNNQIECLGAFFYQPFIPYAVPADGKEWTDMELVRLNLVEEGAVCEEVVFDQETIKTKRNKKAYRLSAFGKMWFAQHGCSIYQSLKGQSMSKDAPPHESAAAMKKLGEAIKKGRKSLDLDVSQFAALAGISDFDLIRHEQGTRSEHHDMLVQILKDHHVLLEDGTEGPADV